jgi:EAL and modified HD-GYP domain-containing signal transduction protein
MIVEGKRLSPSTQAIFQLIKLLQDDAESTELEAAFKRQPELAINLLRLTNSVANGLNVRVTSIRQAVNLLGRLQLMRWLQLLVFAGGKGGAALARNPLMQLAALRARFMEMLAERCYPKRRDLRDAAFLAGLISLMPAALGISMTDILAGIAASPDLRRALSRHEGELGQLLLLTQRYDDNDREGTLEILLKMGGLMNFYDLGECLSEVIEWVQSLDAEL